MPKSKSAQPLATERAAAVSIEKQLADLDTAVEWFYGDDFSLDEALEKYKAAAELAEKIELDLNQLKNEVQVIADFTKS